MPRDLVDDVIQRRLDLESLLVLVPDPWIVELPAQGRREMESLVAERIRALLPDWEEARVIDRAQRRVTQFGRPHDSR